MFLLDIEVALIPYFAEVIVSEKPDKVLELQFSALRQLQARLWKRNGRINLENMKNEILIIEKFR